jgi:hypothetical protein
MRLMGRNPNNTPTELGLSGGQTSQRNWNSLRLSPAVAHPIACRPCRHTILGTAASQTQLMHMLRQITAAGFIDAVMHGDAQ